MSHRHRVKVVTVPINPRSGMPANSTATPVQYRLEERRVVYVTTSIHPNQWTADSIRSFLKMSPTITQHITTVSSGVMPQSTNMPSNPAPAASIPNQTPPGAPRRRIYFYEKNAPYYGFTNFSSHPVRHYDKQLRHNVTYSTSEHLFQSLKFDDPRIKDIIRSAPSPREALNRARQYNDKIRPGWLKLRIAKMDEALWLKFDQHSSLRSQLLGTGDAELIEDSPTDFFWGIGSDHTGENQLGRALMRLRSRLRSGGT